MRSSANCRGHAATIVDGAHAGRARLPFYGALYSEGMANHTSSSSETPRWERVAAFSAIALVGLSVAAMLAIALAPVWGVRDYDTPPWPTVLIFPLIGLPVAFLAFMAVIIGNWRRRSK